jgi:alpha-1,3-rhamnosyl/mannosyltransferase
MPEYHTVSNIRYFETFANKTLPKLAKMITPSVAVKSELVDEFGAREARIEVIPHGVDLDYFSASTAQKQVAASEYDLPDEFVLFVGSIEPRKNLISLIHAHGRLPEGLQRRFPLLVVGAPGWKNSEVRAAIDRSRHARVVGYVKRELLPAVYDSASLFVLPSLYEGFGLPLLEAMAAGAPAIASNVSALPEVAGECAWLVNPLDIDELAEAMRAVLEDRKGAMELAARARQRARQFTWERCALETKDFFASVAGESL